MTDALTIRLHDLATESAGGIGASVDIGAQRTCLKLSLAVQSMSLTSLSVTVESAPTASGPWQALGPLPTVTAAVTRSALLISAMRFTPKTKFDDDNVFFEDQFIWGVNAEGVPGYGPWFLMARATAQGS